MVFTLQSVDTVMSEPGFGGCGGYVRDNETVLSRIRGFQKCVTYTNHSADTKACPKWGSNGMETHIRPPAKMLLSRFQTVEK